MVLRLRGLILWGLVSGCGARSGLLFCDPSSDQGPGIFVPPEGDTGVVHQTTTATQSLVDLLVMIDDSPSMREEQSNLTANLPAVVEELTEGAPRVTNLHLGVVSSDMGTFTYTVETCGVGDDGVLQNLPSPEVVGCDETYPTFLTYEAAAPDPGFATDFQCVGTLGTEGCGLEQQLASVEKALTVHAGPGGPNDGFLRDGSVLAVLYVTDENDCSVLDPRIFADDDTLGPLNLRCFNLPEMTRPVGEFVDSLFSVRPGHPERLVVAGIVGVPTDLVALSAERLASADLQSAADFHRILEDPRMVEHVDYSPEGGGDRIIPACDVPGMGIAFPARRLVELIRDVDARGGNGVVQSICQANWQPVMAAVQRAIEQRLVADCIDPPACAGVDPPDCVLYEVLPDEEACHGAAKLDLGTTDGQRVCEICRVDESGSDAVGRSTACCPAGQGWRLEGDSAVCDAAELGFTDAGRPDPGAVLYLECPCAG